MTPFVQHYWTELLLVTLGHGLVIGMLLGASFLHGCDTAMPDLNAPMELVVEPPPGETPIPTDLAGPPPPAKPQPAPEQEEKAEEKKAEAPPDKDEVTLPDARKPVEKKPRPETKPQEATKPAARQTGKIKVSKTLVRRPMPSGKGKLTADEVRRLLDRGAKLGKKSTLSADDMRRLLNGDSRFGDGSPVSQEFVVIDMVRQAMYRAWDQPTDIGIAGLVTRVELSFSADGSITGSRMLNSSGNARMDASVMKAVQSVRRIPGLPASFLSSHRRIPVAFELTGGQ